MAHYLNLLEVAAQDDVALLRKESKWQNLCDRVNKRAFDKLTDRQFVKRYRLSKVLTQNLIEEIDPHMPPVLRNDALDNTTKVLITLAFFAGGSYQTIVGDMRAHCVSQSSVSKAIYQVTRVLNLPIILNKYVCFPFGHQERQLVKRRFHRNFGMPGCLGCIDCTHVAIVCPSMNEERYYNRKGYHSLNVQLICDADLNIMNVDSSYPGSTHDSVVWSHHPLNAYLDRLHSEAGEDVFLLGDSGYPLRPTMMTPVSNPQPDGPENHYQDIQLSARSIVERCIGVLKARFRCLLVDRKLHYSPRRAARITNACCVLHNIAHEANLPFVPLTAEEAARERELNEGACGRLLAQRGRHALNQLQLGRARRQALINQLWLSRHGDH